MHVAQSIVNLFVMCLKNRPQKQQQIARYFAFARDHELEIMTRNSAQALAPPLAAVQVAVAPLVTPIHPLVSPPIIGV